MTPREAELLRAFLQCVFDGGHTFDDAGVCVVCTAREGGPSIGELLAAGAGDPVDFHEVFAAKAKA